MPEPSSMLEIFPWNHSFETGIELIDQQHRKLVDILNHLAVNLANRSEDVQLEEILDQLASYADYHFKAEEEIWNRYLADDAWLHSHEATHASFITRVETLRANKSSQTTSEIVHQAVSFLTHWLAYHIIDTDKRMAKVVLAIESGLTPQQAKQQADEEMAGAMETIIETILTMYDKLSDRTMALMRERALRLQAEAALRDSEERWHFIFEGESDGVWEWDIENNLTHFSDHQISLFELTGNQSEIAEGSDRIHPDDLEQVMRDFSRHFDGETPFYSNQHRILHANGAWSWVHTRGKIISRDENGKPLRMVGTHTDITEKELATLIYKNTSEGIVITDRNNKTIHTNPAFTNITGYRQEQIIGKDPRILSSEQQSKSVYRDMWQSIHDTGRWEGELLNQRPDGAVYPCAISINCVANNQGNIDHYLALFTDISEKKAAAARLIDQANTDPLTQLPNRRMCIVHLKQNMLKAKRNNLSFAVLYIDLDHFKEVNDSLGHEKGDSLLIAAANRITHLVRDSDTVCRLGGDEFTVIIDELSETSLVERIANDIIMSMKKPFDLGEDRAYITCSIGISLYPGDGKTVTELLSNADQAMYLAKNSGRSCLRYFTTAMQKNLDYRQGIKNELHSALEKNQLEVYYQPIINLETGQLQKAEALLRWFHPERGSIPPEEFIPIAEQSGIINEIGEWVCEQVISQVSEWHHNLPEPIIFSINISPRQLRDGSSLTEKLAELLSRHELSGQNFLFEITEGVLMEGESQVQKYLDEIRSLGSEISLDDFGTGYCSMSYLRQFNINYIKIDRSFISQLHSDEKDSALCQAMIGLSKTLGIKVVAEGVETEEQSEILKSMGCECAQGFFYSHPLPADRFQTLFLDR